MNEVSLNNADCKKSIIKNPTLLTIVLGIEPSVSLLNLEIHFENYRTNVFSHFLIGTVFLTEISSKILTFYYVKHAFYFNYYKIRNQSD